MAALIKFELKKILDKKLVLFGIIAVLFLTIQCSISASYNISSNQYSEDGINYVYGKEAIAKNQDLIKKYSGKFTDETVQQIIKDYDLQKNIDERKNGNSGYEIYNAPSYIYNSATSLVMNKLVDSNGDVVSVNDITVNPEKLYLEYSETYLEFMMDYGTMIVIFAFFTIIAIAPVFNQEYISHSDSIILSSRYGKNKAIYAKILAAFIFVTGTFIIMITLIFGLEVLNYGLSGAKASSDLISFATKDSLTMLDITLLTILFGYIGILLVMMITLILSSVTNSFTTLIISALIYMVPVILVAQGDLNLQKLLIFFPGVFVGSGTLLGLQNITAYNLFNINLDVVNTVILVAICSSIILGYLGYRNFKEHQIQ